MEKIGQAPQGHVPVPKEAEHALEALKALLAIPDTALRARALGEVLKALPGEQRLLSDQRQADVKALLAEPGGSLRSVGARLNLHWSTVQDIAAGHRGSGKGRTRKAERGSSTT